MGLKKRLGLLAVTAASSVTMIAGPVMQAEAAPAAEPARVVAPQHGSNQNGCGGQGLGWTVPDSGYYNFVYWNFHSACDWHDQCYHYHWRTRKGCDDGFRYRMHSWCNNRYPSGWYKRGMCKAKADQYYWAVRAAGWAFY